jgi:hypothetical protein
MVVTRHSWEDNIKIGLEVLWEGVDWIDLVVDIDKWLAVMNTVMNFNVLLTVYHSEVIS